MSRERQAGVYFPANPAIPSLINPNREKKPIPCLEISLDQYLISSVFLERSQLSGVDPDNSRSRAFFRLHSEGRDEKRVLVAVPLCALISGFSNIILALRNAKEVWSHDAEPTKTARGCPIMSVEPHEE
jgi:hypothetical protein